MEKGTFAEFSKFGIDFEDIILWEETEEAEPSPGPGTPTLISESLVQSLQSPRPSLKDAAPEDQDVSFSSCSVPGSVCSWWSQGPSVCSAHDIFICPKVDPKFPKSCSMELVELEEHEGSKPAWGSPLSVGWRILWRSVVGALL